MSIIRFKDRALFVADEVMEQTIRLAEKAAKSHVPVMLCGESGTGKELVARYIHERSSRCRRPFVSVNCAAIPDGLLEAELFGHEKGAFTGATATRVGKFEQANGGTLLLDEISEMPILLQAKLLRVIQEKEVDRLGGYKPIAIDTRIIATTNQDPVRLVESGTFREDLYYRLNVIRVDCYALKGRGLGIERLANYILAEESAVFGVEGVSIRPEAMHVLQAYHWPGNIRELQNVIQRAFLLSDGKDIGPEHLNGLRQSPADGASTLSLFEMERRHIVEVLKNAGGNRTQAAALLGITVRTLRNKLKLYQTL